MSQLKITVYSDDMVYHSYEDKKGEFGRGEGEYKVLLPDGTELKIKTEYGRGGWDFTVDLPEGSKVEPVGEDYNEY